MWPKDFIDWCLNITTDDIEQRTRARFMTYRFFWHNPQPHDHQLADRIAEMGRIRAFEMARDLRSYPGYFPNRNAFKRWLLAVSYRESLRAMILEPAIVAEWDALGEPHNTVLRLLYVDQLTDAELATALGILRSKDAQQVAIAAYESLCQRLDRLGWRTPNLRSNPAYPSFPNAH